MSPPIRSWLLFAPVVTWATLLTACAQQVAVVSKPLNTVTDGVVDVGAVSLHIHCIGHGSPVVVFDAGLGNDGGAWQDVQRDVGRFAQACVYDRAGLGYSGPAPTPHTNRQMARELFTLLQRASIAEPYVLVGHSMGALNIRLLAAEHSDRVAGMVLVDAINDEQPARYWGLLPTEAMAAFRTGLPTMHEGLDYDTLVAGIADMRASSRSIGDKPLVVLTRGREDLPPGVPPDEAARALRAWQELQAELPHLSTNSVHVVARNSRHFIQWDAPKLVVAAVRAVVDAVHLRSKLNEASLAALAMEALSHSASSGRLSATWVCRELEEPGWGPRDRSVSD